VPSRVESWQIVEPGDKRMVTTIECKWRTVSLWQACGESEISGTFGGLQPARLLLGRVLAEDFGDFGEISRLLHHSATFVIPNVGIRTPSD